MATISATSIMLGSSIKRTDWVNKLGHRLNHPNGVMASSREPDQGLPVKKQEAVPQNVNLPPRLPKNKKKPYPIPLKKIQRAARADKKLAEKGIEKPLGPPKNGLLVHDLIPVAYEVLEAWKVLIKGLAQLLSVIPVYGCSECPEVHVGQVGHQIQDCRGPGSEKRRSFHKWVKGSINDVLIPIVFLLNKSQWPRLLRHPSTSEDIEIGAALGELEVKLQNTLKTLELFQSKNADNIFNTVMTYMPQDFRGTLIRQQRERSEKNRQAVVDALVSSGGSIHDRYALLWQQQMERRNQLAQLGSASGVYKTLVKYLVGVPQVLLDFIRQINDDQGPMEEQRQRYGPPLYSLTNMVLSIRLFLLLSWGRFEARKLQKNKLAVLEQAVNVYTSEFERFLKFIGEVFANSPFLISAVDAGAAEARKNDDYKETVIPAGKTLEVLLTVDSVNSYIAWDFSLAQGKMSVDIGFSVEYISPTGEITLILPYRRYESDQGNFSTCMAGCYKLIWDNSYSTFFKKCLRYKVDAIPPVSEIPESVAQPEG